MRRLEYRRAYSIGEVPAEWEVWAEATIVTKEMRAKLRELDTWGRDEFGTYEFRLIDTRARKE